MKDNLKYNIQNVKAIFTSNRKLSSQEDQEYYENQPAEFETAIAATKFGKFNIMMMILSFPASMSAVFDTSTMSYVFPAAQCDLSLTLVDKGTLNAMLYVGMITSGFLWGYLADTLGRKNLLIYCYLLDCLCNICCSFSQTFWMLLIFKFLSGFIVSGPFAILLSYLSEFHTKDLRSRVILLTGIAKSIANVVLPLLAWGIVQNHMDYRSKYFEYHSWNFYILICAIPMFVAGVGHSFLPESPKFLMTTGRNEEALAVFQKVYSMNTGQPKESYPVKVLKEETKHEAEEPSTSSNISQITKPKPQLARITAKRNKITALREGLAQMKPMCRPPFIGQVLLLVTIYFGLLLSMNTLRLWLPQIFTIMDQHQQLHPNDKNVKLCHMLQLSIMKKVNDTRRSINVDKCTVVRPNDQVYINSMIVALCCFAGYIVITLIITKVEKKILLIIMIVIAGSSGLANYWSNSWIMTLSFSSAHVSLLQISCTTIMSMIVELFPTSLRTMTLSLTLLFGRLGSVVGNLLFPVLLKIDCLPPFLLIGGVALVCALLSFGLRSTKDVTFE